MTFERMLMFSLPVADLEDGLSWIMAVFLGHVDGAIDALVSPLRSNSEAVSSRVVQCAMTELSRRRSI